jgi:hypothetical protein
MAFDEGRFMAENYAARIEKVPVPDLKRFFGENEKPVWTVRGLTAIEIAKAQAIADRRDLSKAILDGLITMRADEVKEAITKLVGRSNEIPEEMVKKIEHLVIASVDPVCSEDMAVKISKVAPTTFFTLANAIWNLSGQGMLPGKSKPFGDQKKSKPR